MAQWLARWAHNPQVPGPKPGFPMFVLTQEWPPCSAAALFYVAFCLGKDGSLCWNSVGKYWINIVFWFWNSIGKELD